MLSLVIIIMCRIKRYQIAILFDNIFGYDGVGFFAVLNFSLNHLNRIHYRQDLFEVLHFLQMETFILPTPDKPNGQVIFDSI